MPLVGPKPLSALEFLDGVRCSLLTAMDSGQAEHQKTAVAALHESERRNGLIIR